MIKIGEIASEKPLTEKEKLFLEQIKENNKTHVVDKEELNQLIAEAKEVYKKNFDESVWFERSIFTNWTCGIADCKYCYLSTKPKLDKTAIRSHASILAEAYIMKQMDWKVGYITGGLRVEDISSMTTLLDKISKVLGYKIMLNYGPHTKEEVDAYAPYSTGMGSAIESFDPELHKFICPSKPLPALMNFLEYLKEKKLKKLITIILGIGEKKEDIETVIEKVKEYEIDKVQLCFLKPQEKTVFDEVPSPNLDYMAWWAAKLRIALPKTIIKVALVRDRIKDFSLMLDAGVNCFSRYMVFSDFSSDFTQQLQEECKKAGRVLQGEYTSVPDMNIEDDVNALPFPDEEKAIIKEKIEQYREKLVKLEKK